MIVFIYILYCINQKKINKKNLMTQLNLISKVFTEEMSQNSDIQFILIEDFN